MPPGLQPDAGHKAPPSSAPHDDQPAVGDAMGQVEGSPPRDVPGAKGAPTGCRHRGSHFTINGERGFFSSSRYHAMVFSNPEPKVCWGFHPSRYVARVLSERIVQISVGRSASAPKDRKSTRL